MSEESMRSIIDWYGKVEDISIDYNTNLSVNHALSEKDESIEIDGTNNVTEAIWDNATEKADRTDYIIAVSCGTIAGIIDTFFVGQLSLERAHEWGTEEVP